MRVVITGGSGFIGSRVAAAAAARGHEVRLLGRREVPPRDFPTVVHDLTRSEGLARVLTGVEAVIHCAASLEGNAAEQRDVTVGGTRNLVGALVKASVPRIILVSSFAVYDYTALPPGGVLTEDTPLDLDATGRGPYVAAKREQEQVVRAAGSLQWTILRPGLVFGPGRTWFYQLGMRLPGLWVTLGGAGTIPLTHVDNCAAAIAASLDQPRSVGATINVVDDVLPTRSQYVAWLAAREGRRPVVMDVPWAALNSASRGAWMATNGLLRDRIRPPGSLHPAVLAERCKPLRYDNARAHQLLGWSPTIGIEEGVQAALDQAGRGAG